MIDVRTLETILSDQMEELEARLRETLCHRPEESLVEINSPQAQVVIGVRRSGKSTLCYQALQSKGVKFAYADFDDERLNGLQAEQLNDVLSVLYKIYGDFQHLFLDEVQNIDGWHLFVNRLLRHKMHIIITGSNAKSAINLTISRGVKCSPASSLFSSLNFLINSSNTVPIA